MDRWRGDPAPVDLPAAIEGKARLDLLAGILLPARARRLDLVRYAESRGHEFDPTIPNAWRYRDYVIRAFNGDVPYDQFLIRHKACKDNIRYNA